MKTKISVCFFGLLLALAFFFSSTGRAQTEAKGEAPVITSSFAVERGRYGGIWKIYIEAEDPDGDMFRIASVVHQPGYGYYATDWIILKAQYRKHFKGYLQWNTFGSMQLREWTHITLKVSVLDKAGNESKEVVFPFMFESGVKTQYKLLPQFDQGELPRLGYIHIDLVEPSLMGATRRMRIEY